MSNEAVRTKKVVYPLGDRILVRRRKVGEKIGKENLIVAPDVTKERPTDIADVVFVPDLTHGDKSILNNAEQIVGSLANKAKQGNASALEALLKVNNFIKLKSIAPGDVVMIGKYVGTDFTDDDPKNELTLLFAEEVIGIVREI